MKPLYRNLFLLFGLCAIAFMVHTFPEGWETIKRNPANVLLYLPGVVGIWLFVYLCNAWAFQILVNTSDHDKHLSFAHAMKLTISGFAFSYTTPFGSGGAPYRVMELSRYIGTPRAVSSVALYSMMHVFSHFFLWSTALIAFVIAHFDVMNAWLWSLFAGYVTIFVAAGAFFSYSYKHGIIARVFRLLFFVPFLRRPARRFYERHLEAFDTIDANIRFLYEHPRQLWGSLAAEYVGRLLNSFEFYFILLAFGIPGANFVDGLIILGFSSLMGNLLFFLPMQIGAREGSLAVIVPLLFPGVLLVKIGNKQLMR